MKREYYQWHSHALNRTMELLVFGDSGSRVIVFPTRVGRFFDYEGWGIVESMRERIEKGYIQLFCVDSIDSESLYCDWCEPKGRILRHLQYERYILDEVIPFSQTLNDNPHITAHGCSLGAYHALNIALRHPTIFNEVVSFSGRYDISSNIGPYRDLFDGYYDEDVYFHNPSHYLQNISDPILLEQLRQLDITIVTGEEDVLLENTQNICDAFNQKGINHQFYIWSGHAHRARYWREMVKHYM